MGVQTILPKEPNYMGTKNSSIQNVYKKYWPMEPNLVPEPQVWTTLLYSILVESVILVIASYYTYLV